MLTAPLSRRRLLTTAAAAAGVAGLGLAIPGARPAAASTPPPPVFPDPLMRFVWVDGAFNVRDFGGYAIGCRRLPAGRLFRSSSLNHVTSAGVSLLATLNLGQVADFRSH